MSLRQRGTRARGRLRRACLGLALAAAALSACATMDRAEEARRAREEMVGMREADLLACAGAPERIERTAAGSRLVYVASSRDYPGRAALEPRPGAPRDPLGPLYCRATFVIREGKVAEVIYAGPSGGIFTRHAECAEIVGRCLRKIGRAAAGVRAPRRRRPPPRTWRAPAAPPG